MQRYAPDDTIHLEAAGSYNDNVHARTKIRLTLSGVNGRARIGAASQSSQGKAIWVNLEHLAIGGCRACRQDAGS